MAGRSASPVGGSHIQPLAPPTRGFSIAAHWKDNGCWVWPTCFECPLPKCIDDYSVSERAAIVQRAKRTPFVVSVRRHRGQRPAPSRRGQGDGGGVRCRDLEDIPGAQGRPPGRMGDSRRRRLCPVMSCRMMPAVI